jgi:hypothetical protein
MTVWKCYCFGSGVSVFFFWNVENNEELLIGHIEDDFVEVIINIGGFLKNDLNV